MKLCRFGTKQNDVRIGIVVEDDSALLDLTPARITQLHPLLEDNDPLARLKQLASQKLPRVALSEVRLCALVEGQEDWAAGVTYLRSKTGKKWRCSSRFWPNVMSGAAC
jgi:hypothetical protein